MRSDLEIGEKIGVLKSSELKRQSERQHKRQRKKGNDGGNERDTSRRFRHLDMRAWDSLCYLGRGKLRNSCSTVKLHGCGEELCHYIVYLILFLVILPFSRWRIRRVTMPVTGYQSALTSARPLLLCRRVLASEAMPTPRAQWARWRRNSTSLSMNNLARGYCWRSTPAPRRGSLEGLCGTSP